MRMIECGSTSLARAHCRRSTSNSRRRSCVGDAGGEGRTHESLETWSALLDAICRERPVDFGSSARQVRRRHTQLPGAGTARDGVERCTALKAACRLRALDLRILAPDRSTHHTRRGGMRSNRRPTGQHAGVELTECVREPQRLRDRISAAANGKRSVRRSPHACQNRVSAWRERATSAS